MDSNPPLIPPINQRWRKWVMAAFSIGGTETFRGFMSMTVEGLGRLDCRLIEEDEKFMQLPILERHNLLVSSQQTDQASSELAERLTISQLWVLGAYEVLRTLDQRPQPIYQPQELARLKETKRQFERVRVPLAKQEAARKFPDDNPVPFLGINAQQGIGWSISLHEFVSRRELADKFLDLLTSLSANNPIFPQHIDLPKSRHTES